MILIVEKTGNKYVAAEGKLVTPAAFSVLLNPLRLKILSEIAGKPAYPSEIAGKMRLPEQKVFYHINQLRKGGFVEIERREERRGGLAKYFRATGKAFALKLPNAEEFDLPVSLPNATSIPKFLSGFVTRGGEFDGLVVVGSPDAHGPNKARARDGHYATDLAGFVGSIARIFSPVVRTDTEIKESERKRNLILVGGPITNMLVGEVNGSLRLRFDGDHNWDIYSEKSGKFYSEEECGIIASAKSPWNPDARIVVIAGKRFSGTRSSILAILSGGEKFSSAGNLVVEGTDLDGDGIVDSAEIKESF
ncbi:MAG: helix-turn-helix domain-containing protein [archaeon]